MNDVKAGGTRVVTWLERLMWRGKWTERQTGCGESKMKIGGGGPGG